MGLSCPLREVFDILQLFLMLTVYFHTYCNFIAFYIVCRPDLFSLCRRGVILKLSVSQRSLFMNGKEDHAHDHSIINQMEGCATTRLLEWLSLMKARLLLIHQLLVALNL